MSLAAALGRALGRDVARLDRVAGGDLNEAYAATLGDGARVFVKTSADARAGAFAAEASGLRWLADARAVAVPEVLAVGDYEGEGDGTSAAAASATATCGAATSWSTAPGGPG